MLVEIGFGRQWRWRVVWCCNSSAGCWLCLVLGFLMIWVSIARVLVVKLEWLDLASTRISIGFTSLRIFNTRSKLETLRDAFDVAIQAVINKVTRLRKDIIEGRKDDNFIEELSWKYALLDEGQEIGPHEWDPFFSKPKPENADSDCSSADAAKNSWKNEQRQHS